jgi:cytochrome bd-type quinol oxidase subunit 1
MSQAQAARDFEYSLKKTVSRIMQVLLPAVLALEASAAMIPRWHTFAWDIRFMAGLFFLILALTPFVEILAEKKGRPDLATYLMRCGYVLAMLAITIFAGH